MYQSPLILRNFLNKNQLEEIIKCQFNNQHLSITSYLNSDNAQILGNQLLILKQLQSLRIQYIPATLENLKPLVSIGESLTQLHLLECLDIDIQKQNNFDGECVYQLINRLSSLKKLSQLSFMMERAGQLDLKTAKNIKKSLKNLTNLTHLAYNLEICLECDEGITNEFIKSLKHLVNLTHLKFILQIKEKKIYNDLKINIESLPNCIMNLTNLKTFTFQLSNDYVYKLLISDKNLILLSDGLTKLQSLEKVNFQFYKLQFELNTITYLINALFKIQSLEELEFYVKFDSPSFRKDNNIINQSIKENSKLKKLVLNLNAILFPPNKAKIYFGKGFQYLTNLQHLCLILNEVFFDKQSFLAFDDLFSNCKLEQLKLQINSFEEQYCEQLCSSLKKQIHLKESILLLSSCKGNSKFPLAQGIEGKEKLEKLQLNFSFNDYGGEESSLISCFQSLKNLQELKIQFKIDHKTEDKMTLFGQALKNLSLLVKLELEFVQIFRSDRFQQISGSFRYMTQLQVLRLHQSNMKIRSYFSQNQFFELINEIKTLHSLRELHINFFPIDVKNNDDKFAFNVLKYFEKLDSLRDLLLRFQESPNINLLKITRKLIRLIKFQQ